MEPSIQILICDDDPAVHVSIKNALKNQKTSYALRSAYHADEALLILQKYPVDILILDIQMRTPQEGLEYLPRLKSVHSDLAVIISSYLSDFQTVRQAMRLGAMDYIPKSFDTFELIHTLESVFERRSLLKRYEQKNYEVMSSQKKHVLIGNSPPMQQLRRTLERFQRSRANVLITGETGTGKEVVARQLRSFSPDSSLLPFVAIDSATIQQSTAESILFGHEKGAFTGAEKTTKGLFEEADQGMVYFDEISNMSLEIQAKLLRVLQEKEVTRLGATRSIPLDFRVISATNKDLEVLCRNGLFKEDLYQRLSVLPIVLPPLRERKEDIPELFTHFLKLHLPLGRSMRVSAEVIAILQHYSWPGNIRELSNLVAWLVTMIDGEEIEISDLPPKFRDHIRGMSSSARKSSFYEQVGSFERDLLSKEYLATEGNISKLALALEMDRSHLYTKLREHGIHVPKK